MSLNNKRKGLLLAAGVLFLFYLILLVSPYRALRQFRKDYYSLPILDRNGEELRVLPLENGLRRMYVPLRSVPDPVKKIIIDSEDRRFYFHPGFDPPALIRAVYQTLRFGRITSGGSTITMQLSRMISPRPPGIRGKFFEIWNALRIETRLSKQEILELYINHLPFGNNLEGLETASRYYFGKSTPELSPEEALVLMMIPRRPADFDPLINPQANLKAAGMTLPRLRVPVTDGTVSAAVRNVTESAPFEWVNRAPHFVLYTESLLNEQAFRSGNPVVTTLDLEKQSFLEGILALNVERSGEFRISNAAGLLIDNETGGILAYVGSVDFFDSDMSGQIDGVRIRRQPGSTLKPYLYAMALEHGFNTSTILPDIPISFGGSQIYVPENYNERFNGPVRFSVALGSSLNVPAVYLLERLGVENFRRKLLELGIRSLEKEEDLGVGLALGNAEVRLLELVRAFSVFTREGKLIPLTVFLTDSVSDGCQVFNRDTALVIRNILSDPLNRVLGFGREGILNTPFDAIFKTGTSNQFNNIWAFGSTTDLTCGVWMGNFSGETVIGRPGSSIPAGVVVSVLGKYTELPYFPPADTLVPVEICTLSGLKASPCCSHTITEFFIPESEPEICDWHNGSSVVYPAEYGKWLEASNQSGEVRTVLSEPVILSPVEGAVYYRDPTIPDDSQMINFEIIGSGYAELFLDNELLGQRELPSVLYIPLKQGFHELSCRQDSSFVTVRYFVR